MGNNILYVGLIANNGFCTIEVLENKIQYNLKENATGYLNVFAVNNENYKKNDIIINGRIKSLQNMENNLNNYDETMFEENNITINSKISYLLEGYNFCNNKVYITQGILIEDGVTPSIFRYIRDIYRKININNNEIIIENSNEWQERTIKMFLFYDIALNNYDIDICNNKIIANTTKKQDLIIMNNIKDTESQKIYFKNNDYGVFKVIALPFRNIHKVIINDIEITEETVLD